MLIPSHRHTEADLRLWREHEAADLIHARRPRIALLVAKSIEAIRSVSGPRHCGVSWGKDSVVVAHLLRTTAPHVPLVYLRQTTENPDCLLVRDDYLSRFPGQQYIEIPVIYDAGIVSHKNSAWKNAIEQAEREHGKPILGLRADESGMRRLSMRHLGLTTDNVCRPIGWWSVADVFAYLAAHELPVHPVYAMTGGGRWPRATLRTASITGTDADNFGRREHTSEYYGDVLRRLESGN